MKARDTLEATRAFGQLRKSFFVLHLQARFLGGPDKEIGTASDVFEGEVLQRLSAQLSAAALNTPVFLTDHLSDRLLAGCITLQDGSSQIAVNARFKVDPEVLLHTLAEEFAHAQQVIDRVDIAEQKRQYAYADRPYELQAKQIATLTLGYEPQECEVTLWRPEPPDTLYDRPE